MARVFDCSPQAFDQYVRPHAPPEAVRQHGREVYFWARQVIEAWAVRHVAEATGSDPMMAGNTKDSPALEQYRRWKAELARIEVLTKKGLLVPVHELTPSLTRLGMRIRRAGEQLQQRFGVEAVGILEEALDEFDDEIVKIDAGGGESEADQPFENREEAAEPPNARQLAAVPGRDHGGSTRRDNHGGKR